MRDGIEVALSAHERGHDCSFSLCSSSQELEVILYLGGFNACSENAQFFRVCLETSSVLAPVDPASTIREIMSRIVEQMDEHDADLEVRGEDF